MENDEPILYLMKKQLCATAIGTTADTKHPEVVQVAAGANG